MFDATKLIVFQDLSLIFISFQFWMYPFSKTANIVSFTNWMHRTNACSRYLLGSHTQAGSKI